MADAMDTGAHVSQDGKSLAVTELAASYTALVLEGGAEASIDVILMEIGSFPAYWPRARAFLAGADSEAVGALDGVAALDPSSASDEDLREGALVFLEYWPIVQRLLLADASPLAPVLADVLRRRPGGEQQAYQEEIWAYVAKVEGVARDLEAVLRAIAVGDIAAEEAAEEAGRAVGLF